MPRKVTLLGSTDLSRDAMSVELMPTGTASSRSSGRVRHEEKITVYISRAELFRLEQARLNMRAEYGLSIDRGRLVRAAVAAALDDLETKGRDAELLRRLVEQ